ncbi:hypothetical protein KIMH_07850 [Bombiscardovia apis]|uniref:ABC transporter permease n=1 Tax=Bombiscardovia apis TaxID=2932182 RepID=A0ABM8BCN0_9BIFI|nr:hypothetical protein [Bombiscardovia apis]BDR54674.1 hypothetical protein KIMH_07850 [Bombiscardovia apis]
MDKQTSYSDTLRERVLSRLGLLVIYLVVFFSYLSRSPDTATFIGMFPKSVSETDLLSTFDFTVFSFLEFGLLLSLGQPQSYLLEDNWLVYIRRRRGAERYIRYIGLVLLYALLYSVPQLFIMWGLMPQTRSLGSLADFVCGLWMLIVLLLVADAIASAGNRIVGFLVSTVLAYAYSGLSDVQHLLLGHSLAHLPNWIPILAISTVLILIINYQFYKRSEIL